MEGSSEKPTERIFLDSNILLTAVCYDDSDSAKLLEKCREKFFVGVISQKVLEECYHKLEPHQGIRAKFDEIVRCLEVLDVQDEDLDNYTTIRDLNDRHVLAGAAAGNANYLVTLDWKHFLSSSAKRQLAGYPIRRTFPGVLTSSFRDEELPKISMTIAKGTFAIGVDPDWTSETIRHARRPFFILDLEGVFSLWYKPSRFRIKMRTETYERQKTLSFPRVVNKDDAFICIVTWNIFEGFTLLLDGKMKTIR